MKITLQTIKVKFMKNLIRLSFLLSLFFPLFGIAQDSRTVDLDVPSIKDWLANAPNENSAAAANTAIVIDLPLVNGESISVKVLESPMLFNSKSGIRTYSFIGFEDSRFSGRLMVSDRGIDAHMFTPDGRFLIQPVNLGAAAHQISLMTGEFPHAADDVRYPDGFLHQHEGEEKLHQHDATARNLMATPYAIGDQLRKFRMHVIADREYGLAVLDGATLNRANVFAAIMAAVNSMNAFYVKEMSVMLTLDESLTTIYLGANPGTFGAAGVLNSNPDWSTESLRHHLFLETNTSPDGSGGTNAMVLRNSYDVGHLFSGRVGKDDNMNDLGGGGAAFLQGVCNDVIVNDDGPLKAGGGSGGPDPEGSGWIDLLSHEFTHQFNADHTWSGNSGNCTSGQFSGGSFAYEPGAGSTIVAYAGICPFPGQETSDPRSNDNIPNPGNTSYYHTISIKQVDDWVEGSTATCETTTNSGNQIPVPSGATSGCTANYTIPPRTPFYIKGSATDGNDPASQLTYTWEQFNTASDRFDPIDGPTMKNGNDLFPIFRSFAPTNNAGRTIPQISTILSGKYNGESQNAASLTQTNWEGELLPEVTGNITMRLTVRDNNATAGGVEFADVDITVSGSTPFSVTSPSSAISVAANSTVDVAWNVAGTNASPFNHTNVTIKLSVDGGETFPYSLATTANDGMETVTIPNGIPGTTKARIRVEAGTECFYFFDINNADFTITNTGCAPNGASFSGSGDVTAEAGNASLNLSLSAVYGNTLSVPFTGTITDADLQGGLIVGNTSATDCINFAGNTAARRKVINFTAASTATYTFTLGVTAIIAIYNGAFDNNNSCSNFIMSNYVTSTGSFPQSIQVNLESGKSYSLVVMADSAFSIPTPLNYNVGVSGGNLLDGAPNPGGNYSYTYAAINSSGVISKIDAGADFTSLAGGGEMYTVYGFSVLNTDLTNFNAQEGQSFTNFTNGTYCAGISSNTIKLTVTGDAMPDPCATSDKVVTSADITPPTADTVRAGGTITTSGTVEVTSSHNVAFLAPTSITLATGFHAQAGSEFLAKIEACVTSLQEEEPVLTVYKYSPETEEVVAIDTKPTAVTTTLETSSLNELDLKIAPNPARDFTNMTFNLGKASQVNLTIYDMSGRAVEAMVQGQTMPAGWHQIQYTPQSIKGGMYYVVLQADKEVVTKKMILVR